MGQHAASQVFGELALNMTGQSATFGVGCAHLGEHRLPVPRDEFVQHCTLGFAASVAGERLSGCAGGSFVDVPANTYGLLLSIRYGGDFSCSSASDDEQARVGRRCGGDLEHSLEPEYVDHVIARRRLLVFRSY